MKILKNNSSGFTLIELMISIAMIIILTGILAPNIMSQLPNYRLKAAAKDLYSNMQKARIQAIKENTTIRIRFNNGSFYYFDIDDDITMDADEFRIDLSSYGSGVNYGSGSAATNWSGNLIIQAPTISFGSRGTANAASVYLDNGENSNCYAITTASSGTMRMRFFNGISWN